MRRFQRLVTTSLLSAAIVAPGCSKDEPAPPPAPAADVAVAEKPEAPKPETPKPTEPEAPKPTEPAPEVKPEPGVAPSGRFIQRPPLSSDAIAELPADVLGVGATASLKSLVEAFTKLQPGAPDFDALLSLLQRGSGLGDLSKIAWDKPLYVVFPNPTRWEDGFVWVATTAEGFDVKATFPGATENAGVFTLELEGNTLAIQHKGSHLHIASHADLLTTLGDFLGGPLVAWTPKNPLQLDGSVENALKVYAKEIAEARQMLPMLQKQLEEGGADAGQLAMLSQTAESSLALLEGTRRIGLAVDPTTDFPRIAFTATFKEGTDGAAFVADTKDRKASFAKEIPASAWLSFAGAWDPKLGASTVEEIEALLGGLYADMDVVSWQPGELKAIAEKVVKLQGLAGVQQAFWLHTVGERPFALESVSSVTDATEWRATLLGVFDVLLEKFWAMAKLELAEELGADGKKFEGGLEDAFALAAEMAAPMGIKLEKRKDDTLAGVKVSVDWSKIPADGETEEREVAKRLFGDTLELGIATKGDRAAITLSPDGWARAEALAGGANPTADLSPWLTRASERAWMVLTINPAPLLDVASKFPNVDADMAGMMRQIPALPITVEGIGGSDRLHVELELPLDLLKAFGNIGMR